MEPSRFTSRKIYFRKKALTIVIILAITISLHSTINAQIEYTYINKTFTLGGAETYDIYFFQPYPHFVIYVDSSSKADWAAITPWQNEVLCDTMTYMGDTLYLPKVLNEGDTIDENQSFWMSSQDGLILNRKGTDTLGDIGNWAGVSNKFIGLRAQFGGWLYGWVRVTISNDATSIVVVDEAHFKQGYPDNMITAGKMVGLNENERVDNISLFTYNRTLYIDLQNNLPNNCKVNIISTLGKNIKEFTLYDNKMEIDLFDIPDGVYIVNVYLDKEVVSRKISIQ